MTTLLIATRNAHKVQEISQMLDGDFRCLDLNGFPGAPAVVEDAETFVGNASLKVLSLAGWLARHPELVDQASIARSSFYLMADDSGLEVDALGGAPGVHSARFSASDTTRGNAPDADNNAKLLRLLADKPPKERAARFRCVLAVLLFDSSPEEVLLFDGTCEGSIATQASGQGGFGYDPLFIPNGCRQSFAELGGDFKNESSHRARAVQKLRRYFTKT